MLQRLPQEPDFPLSRGKERLEEAGLVVMSDVTEGQGKPHIEPVRKMPFVKIGLHEPDELLGEPHLLLCGFPLRRRESVGSEVFDAGKHGCPSLSYSPYAF